MTDKKAPIDPYVEDAERETKPPAGTPTDPAKVIQELVDEDAATDLDPETDPRTGFQR